MTQKQKELLLVDLCGRLPYHPKGLVNGIECIIYPHDVEDLQADSWPVNPYLRPMSSMTEKERKELFEAISKDMRLLEETLDKEPLFRCGDGSYYGNPIHYELDFLISHHFDYRGLISRGLAIPAKEGMYNIK